MANTVVNAWTVSPKWRCVEVPTPVAEKVTLFGNRVTARAFSSDVVLLVCRCPCTVMSESLRPHGLRLAVRGAWVRPLTWGDPTPTEQLSPRTTTLERSRSQEPQLLRPTHPRAFASQREKPLQQEAHTSQTQQQTPSAAKNNNF